MKMQVTSQQHHSTTSTNAVDNVSTTDTTAQQLHYYEATTTINNMVMCNYKDLSDAAFKLYCVLAMFADEDIDVSIVSISTLAEVTGKQPETVQTLLKELISHELIDWCSEKLLDTTKWLNTPSQCIICQNLSHFIMNYDPRFGYFSTVDEVIGIVLFPNAYKLYEVLAMLAGETAQVEVSIRELAKLFGKPIKDTKKWLNILIYKGVIEVIAPDTYVIHDSLRDSWEA